MIYFKTDKMDVQEFALKETFIYYFIMNLKPEHLIKLYQCCKFFYARFCRNSIRHLVIVDDNGAEILNATKTTIRASNTALKKLADFWISDSFTSRARFNVKITLPTFSRCIIKKLELCDYIKQNEFLMLTKAGTIEELKITSVFAENGGFIPIEDIVIEVPYAKSIEFSAHFTEESHEALLSVNHNVKFTKFILRLRNPVYIFNIDKFEEFIRKNAETDCHVRIKFESYFPPSMTNVLISLEKSYNDTLKQLWK
uniref:Uncharacterized protein n=1 Tax=Panagrolaimus davidi TaxID=227884 RepID=A0A914PGZ5_9BILA